MKTGKDGVKVGGYFTFECRDKNGNLKWTDRSHNLVVNVGLQHLLDVLFAGDTQINPWYLGLTDGTPTVAASDTMASHSGWTEVVAYSESARQEYVDVRSGQSVTNSASVAAFSINADTTTVGGGFLTSLSTKGGTTGILLCDVAFTGGDKSADSGDTINVTYTFSASDDA